MKKETQERRDSEIRNLAEALVEKPNAASIVSLIFYENAKHGIRKVNERSANEIDSLSEEEEEDIPLDVLSFLKKKKNICLFFNVMRDLIIDKLIDGNISDEDIFKFVDYFDYQMIEKYHEAFFSENVKKLMVMVCLDISGVYDVIEPDRYISEFQKLYNNLNLDEPHFVKALYRISILMCLESLKK